MKRLCYLAALMMLSTSAHAGNFSFVVGGHRIHIEAPRHCLSASCVSVSIPGIYETRHRRDDADEPGNAPPAKPPAPEQAAAPAAPAAVQCVVTPVASAPTAPVTKPAVAARQEIAAPPPPVVELPKIPVLPPQVAPIEKKPIAKPIDAARPAPDAAARITKVLHEIAELPDDTPLGDWQTEGRKGSVRIEQCGRALCGYVLDAASGAKTDAVLVNMKPKGVAATDVSDRPPSEWSGNIYSRESGSTYYATMTLKVPNSLRVEACALGKFFCTGNIWSRVTPKPASLISSSRAVSPDHS
jgi:uncharacterized protein (DUF2147 family)